MRFLSVTYTGKVIKPAYTFKIQAENIARDIRNLAKVNTEIKQLKNGKFAIYIRNERFTIYIRN